MILGKDIALPEGVTPNMVSDGYHTFDELYEHRIRLFLVLLAVAAQNDLQMGWSKRHSDGELCFGGGWVLAWITTPSGLQARYHLNESFILENKGLAPLMYFQNEKAPVWNGVNETLEALVELERLIWGDF